TAGDGYRISEHVYFPFGVEATRLRQEHGQGWDRETRLKYTGHERDYLGGETVENTNYLDYMHARYYNPNLGRFLSVDPIRGQLQYPQSWNRYTYVRNSPLNYTDPTGLAPCTVTYRGETFPSDCVDVVAPPYQGDYAEWKAINRYFDSLVAWRDQTFDRKAAYDYYIDRNNPWLAAVVASDQELLTAVTLVGGLGGGGRVGGSPKGVPAPEYYGGQMNATQALKAADAWLGPGYTEIAPGVYRSGDGLRQFRMTDRDLGGHGGTPSHVHFESVAPNGRTFTENTYVHITVP
ncbi:MAG: RHS repeat-associated core domain-containing protein, partial [Rhodococcus sp. (in: high G+C Gram-positive bacteria)]